MEAEGIVSTANHVGKRGLGPGRRLTAIDAGGVESMSPARQNPKLGRVQSVRATVFSRRALVSPAWLTMPPATFSAPPPRRRPHR
jgi:hypothetical protein